MSTTIQREALAKIANIVRPALSTLPYIPAYQHILFDGKQALAYNDISAIAVAAEFDIERCLPGEMLIKALGSFAGAEVLLQEDPKSESLLLSSGRSSKLKLPTLPHSSFKFRMPAAGRDGLALTDDIIAGIGKCLISVGNNQKHPATLGVTMDEEGGCAVLYSIDNATISRCATKSKVKLPGGAPVILPTFFCEQMTLLAKAFPKDDIDLHFIGADGLLVTFGKSASLFTKTISDLSPLDFPSIIKKNLDLAGVKLEAIPDAFDAAFGRAMLVLANEMDKTATIKPTRQGFSLHAESAYGVADDDIAFKGEVPDSFSIDPTYVLRAAKVCTHLACTPRVLVMGSGDSSFLHMIAHVS